MAALTRFLKEEKFLTAIIALGFLSYCRTFVVAPHGDEITYLKIAGNILTGRYYMNEFPSTVTPVIPFVSAFFTTTFNPAAGIALHKLFCIFVGILGFRYVFKFLINAGIAYRIALTCSVLTAVTSICVEFVPSMYPEAILFFSFWGFLYHASSEKTMGNYLKMLLFFLLVVFTRHVFAVLFPIVLLFLYDFQKKNPEVRNRLFLYGILVSLPLLLWLKYVYNIEKNNLSEISYFQRFKTENQWLENIKAGIGLIKHPEVNRINGIPAFINLFVPITGLRNFPISIVLLLASLFGYYKNLAPKSMGILFYAILAVFVGYIIAGTGFSRYWVVLLPGFYLGYVLLLQKFRLQEKYIVLLFQMLMAGYVLNELRLDYMVLRQFLQQG